VGQTLKLVYDNESIHTLWQFSVSPCWLHHVANTDLLFYTISVDPFPHSSTKLLLESCKEGTAEPLARDLSSVETYIGGLYEVASARVLEERGV